MKLKKFNKRLWLLGPIFTLATAAILLAARPSLLAQPVASPELRGVWVQSRSIATAETLLQTINRVETGRFNAIFVEVMVGDGAFYNSRLVKKHETVAASFDPLAQLISEAHQRNIKVNAWFSVGYLLANHPAPTADWVMVNADGTEHPYWSNYAHPEARQWLTEVILEVVANYEIDGVHLDHVRYPETNVSFDSYSRQAMAAKYQVDLELLRGTTLPAFGRFRGNPLVKIETAQVLAQFDNGTPAVLLNSYQQGQVVVLNWIAGDRPIAASSQILRRSLDYLQQNGSPIYLFDDNLSASYHQNNIRAILNDLGLMPPEIKAADIAGLDQKAVLIIPNVYKIPDQMADDLETFVGQGGSLIFIDGPVRSIENPKVQLLTGTSGSGDYFDQTMKLIPVSQHPIIPVGASNVEVDYETLYAKWNEFRMQGVTAFVQETYQQVKMANPNILVSAAVKSRHSDALRMLQDWPVWIANGIIDRVMPMAYVQDTLYLQRDLLEWRLITSNQTTQIVPGLSVDFESQYPLQPKPVEQVFREINLSRTNGYQGFVLFDIEHVSDDLLQALSTDSVTP